MRVMLDNGEIDPLMAAAFVAGLGVFLSPQMLRFGVPMKSAVRSSMIFGLSGLMMVLITEGPSVSAATPLVLLAPILIGLSLSVRETIWSGWLAVFAMTAVFGSEAMGFIGEAGATEPRESFLRCIVISALLLLQTMILTNFARTVRRAREHLIAAHAAADSANTAKSQFLATASHELRTPLNGVIGMTQILLRSDLSDRQRKMTEIVDGSAVSLLKILNDVFDATEINSGLFRLTAAPFDVEELAAQLIENHEHDAWEKGLGLRMDIRRAARGHYMGDALRIRQVVTRLMENAIKFTETGAITVIIDRNGKGETQFHVRDNGPGLSEADQERIFEQFQQVDQSETRRFGGLGLGLANARNLAELMQGRLSVESKLGDGAKFTLTVALPRGPDATLARKLAS